MSEEHQRGTLWTAAEAAEATGGEARGEWAVFGLSIDSRTVAPGEMFIALTAARDGHDFVADALARGAAAAMVSRAPEGVAADAPLLVVPDVQAGLEALGRAGRARMQGTVMAITGSVGKTSAKDMARLVLAQEGHVHVAEASFNNQWGVPLTLARMPADSDFAVIEIGMNHPGEIAPLARMARPHLALITTIAPAHLAAFPDGLEGIAREKAAIFEGLEPGGLAVIPNGLPVSPILHDIAEAHGARVVGFGPQLASDHPLGSIGAGALGFSLPGAAVHMAHNALGVLAACMALGIHPMKVTQGLLQWHPAPGRGGVETLGDLTLIDDSFNANPASMAAGLASLAGQPGEGRRVAILGDMLELGPEAESMHVALAEDPSMASIDRVHAAGPLMRSLMQALPPAKRGLWTEAVEGLIDRLPELVQPGDIVLVKGSKSSRVASLVDALRASRQSA